MPYEVRSLAGAIAKRGEVVFAGGSSPGVEGSSMTQPVLSPKPFRAHEVEGILANIKPDLVYVPSLWLPIHNAWLHYVRKKAIPYIIAPHGAINPWMLRFRFGGKRNSLTNRLLKTAYHSFIDRPCLRRAFAIHALSTFERDAARRHTNVPIIVAPNGVDSSWINPAQHPKAPSLVWLLFIGRIEPLQKGLDLVFDALEMVSPELKNRIHLVIAGPIAPAASIWLQSQIARAKGVSVTLIGPVQGQAKVDLLHGATYFLHLSRYEGMARAAREAVGHGLPLIASRESNFGDWVTQHKIGITAELAPLQIAKAIESAVKLGQQEYTQMRQNCFQYASMNSWDSVAGTFLQELQALSVK